MFNVNKLLFTFYNHKGKAPGDAKVKDLRSLKYTADGKIYYKIVFDDEFKLLPQSPKAQIIAEPKRLHQERLRISHQKWKHLQELKSVLPAGSHKFYDDLPHQERKSLVQDSEKLQKTILEKLKLVKSAPNKKSKSVKKLPKKILKKSVESNSK